MLGMNEKYEIEFTFCPNFKKATKTVTKLKPVRKCDKKIIL